MLNGNAIHDDLFDFSAVNVHIDEAAAMAGDEFMVDNVVDQIDISGHDPINQLKHWIRRLVDKGPLPLYSVISAHGLTVLFTVNVNKSAMIIDSHTHGSKGAVIAFCSPQNVSYLGCWFASMLQNNYSIAMSVVSLSRIVYMPMS